MNLRNIGPGFLLAGAAIGVSHLVQATRAGAEFGWILIIALVVACITKYPFLLFGPLYTSITQKNLIKGYLSLGKWAFWMYITITVASMFIITAAVSLVTAGLAAHLFGLNVTIFYWSVILLFFCLMLLSIGRYQGLDRSMKIIISLLTLCTFFAVIIAAIKFKSTSQLIQVPSLLDTSSLAFIVAFMGWMPIPIDASVWHSLWTQEKGKTQGQSLSKSDALWDFNIGYFAASVIAVLFFALGVLVMFGSSLEFSNSAIGFAQQLVELYSKSLGNWAEISIGFAAFITMLSTTLAVTDAYPRVISNAVITYFPNRHFNPQKIYFIILGIVILCSLSIIQFASHQFTNLVDFAAAISFLTAPVLGYFNLKLMQSDEVKSKHKLSKSMIIYTWTCLCFLILFNFIFIYSQIIN
ncbi:MAG: divalent metal cation transporter [Flavobacteriaceae bacterium]|nr:divalent metal cation transporter [Flavobacteriaceae bacterium]